MSDLERTLHELAAATRYPPTPDLSTRVVAAIPLRRRRRRRVAVLAFAATIVAVGVAFAVPPARSAILDWLGFGPIEVQRVERSPRAPRMLRPSLGRATTLAEASRLLGFRILAPPGQPDGVFVGDREVTLVYGPLLLSEFRGGDVFVARKVVGPETRTEDVRVAGAPGLWLAGAPHLFAYLDKQGAFRQGHIRLAGNTLLWQHEPLVLRLEGAKTKAEALRFATSVN
jgi:hypothetical protein